MAFLGYVGALLVTLVLSCVTSQPGPDAETPVASQPAEPGDAGVLGATLGQPFELAMGQTALIPETGLRVTFQKVLEDSRCPAQVSCVWAGRVTVELEVQVPNQPAETFPLSTCCPAADVSHHVYAAQSVDLLDLAPSRPRPEDVIAQADYRLKIAVTAT